jgi:hypothetical protein
VATGGKNRDDRVARERARVYRARQEFHDGQARRRRRDNIIAGLAGGLLILAVIGGQTAYFTLGPGAPDPEPAPTPTETSTPPATPDPTTTPGTTDAPAETPTPGTTPAP